MWSGGEEDEGTMDERPVSVHVERGGRRKPAHAMGLSGKFGPWLSGLFNNRNTMAPKIRINISLKLPEKFT